MVNGGDLPSILIIIKGVVFSSSQGVKSNIYRDAVRRFGTLHQEDDEDEDDVEEEDEEEEEEEEAIGEGLDDIDGENAAAKTNLGKDGCFDRVSNSDKEFSGYVDELLLGGALNLSLERPEEAVQGLKARLGLQGDVGGDENGDNGPVDEVRGEGLVSSSLGNDSSA